MSAWTKFATQFFHNKQKQNSEYKFSQALKEASKVYKKTKGGSRKQQGGNPDSGTVSGTVSGTATEEVEDINQKKYSFDNEATDFLEYPKENRGKTQNDGGPTMNLKELYDMIEQSTIDVKFRNNMKKKFNELDEFKNLTDDEKKIMNIQEFEVLSAEDSNALKINTGANIDTPPTETKLPGTGGGKKSKRKSKKAGKKSQKKQKKAKKAGSKKSKK
jgi:superoxide dismutase